MASGKGGNSLSIYRGSNKQQGRREKTGKQKSNGVSHSADTTAQHRSFRVIEELPGHLSSQVPQPLKSLIISSSFLLTHSSTSLAIHSPADYSHSLGLRCPPPGELDLSQRQRTLVTLLSEKRAQNTLGKFDGNAKM